MFFVFQINSKHSYDIIETATKLGMTGKEYQWILTRNCIPVGKNGPSAFPVGMLGTFHFVIFFFDDCCYAVVVADGVGSFDSYGNLEY